MSPPAPGSRSRYEVLGRAGRGATGEVFQARDRKLNRVVALKRFHPGDSAESRQALGRFLREALILGAHPHPGLVPIYDSAPEADPPFLVLGWMGGGDLEEFLEGEGRQEPPFVARLGERLAGALAHLHHHGILHRDIKPANVLRDEAGEFFLADLGLARGEDSSELTATGYVVGTPLYMAPEILSRGEYSERTDLFALGAMLLEVALGRRLGGMASDLTVIRPALAEVPDPELRRVLAECLVPDPTQRPRDGSALAERLAQLLVEDELPGGTWEPGFTEEQLPLRESSGSLSLSLSTSKDRPPPGNRDRSRFWGGLALATLVLGLGLGVVTAPSPEPPGALPLPEVPPPREERGQDPSHPLDDLPEALEAELDRYLSGRWDESLQPTLGEEGRSFPELYRRQGMSLLLELPAQRRFYHWMAGAAPGEELPPHLLAKLRDYDRAFPDLGMIPPLHPFLVDPPGPETAPLPASLEPYCGPGSLLPPRARAPRRGWTRRALEELAAYHDHYAALWRRHQDEPDVPAYSPDWDGGPEDYPGVFGNPLGNLFVSEWLALPELAEEMIPGREAARRFFYACLRAMDENPRDGDWLQGLVTGPRAALLLFLRGPMGSAQPCQVHGRRGRHPRTLLTQAILLRRMRIHRQKLLITGPSLLDLQEEWLERAREEAFAIQDPGLALECWQEHLNMLSKHDRPGELEALYRIHRDRFQPHLGRQDRERLREQLHSVGSPLAQEVNP